MTDPPIAVDGTGLITLTGEVPTGTAYVIMIQFTLVNHYEPTIQYPYNAEVMFGDCGAYSSSMAFETGRISVYN